MNPRKRRSWVLAVPGLIAVITSLPSATSTASAAFGFRPGIVERRSRQDAQIHATAAAARSAAATVTVAVSSILFLGLALIPPAAHASGDALCGSALFAANCASCHAGGLNFVNEKRTLKKDALETFLGGFDEETIRSFVKESSRHQNQAYFRAPGGKLSEVDFDDAAAYVSQTAAANAW
jgi:cytochrome c6